MKSLQEAADYLSLCDAVLAPVIQSSPLPSFVAHTNYYQTLVESIISQQLSVRAAHTIRTRFLELFSNHFPTPEQIMKTDIEALRTIGLSRPKAMYIQDLAKQVIGGVVRFDTLDQLSNEAIVSELTFVKGIGEWTVHMFLIFCMGRLDVLPTGDLGIRSGIKKLYALSDLPSEDKIITIANNNHWHPYESVASWYIWQSLKNNPDLT